MSEEYRKRRIENAYRLLLQYLSEQNVFQRAEILRSLIETLKDAK